MTRWRVSRRSGRGRAWLSGRPWVGWRGRSSLLRMLGLRKRWSPSERAWIAARCGWLWGS